MEEKQKTPNNNVIDATDRFATTEPQTPTEIPDLFAEEARLAGEYAAKLAASSEVRTLDTTASSRTHLRQSKPPQIY